VSKNSSTTVERRDRKQEEASQPVYFLSLTVENVRCFGPKQTLDLSDGNGRPAQWTILLGENGVGKTTLLQCLGAISPRESFIHRQELGRKAVAPRYSSDTKMWLEWHPFRRERDFFQIRGNILTGIKLNEKQAISTVREFKLSATRDQSKSTAEDYEVVSDGACFGYGAARRMGQTSLSDTIVFDPLASLFSESVALRNAEEWLLQADYAASKPSQSQGRAKKRLDRIQHVLTKSNLLPEVTDLRFVSPSEAQLNPRVEFKTPYGWVSIKDLGLGYRTLITWMVDFAVRLFELYPHSSNPLAEPAIVLVDEIDLHLHPKWQYELINHLTKLFPNTQFIATAHSPLVVQAAANANIVLLKREGDHVTIDNDPRSVRGLRIDQIYTTLFGLEGSRGPQIDPLLAERNKILSKGRVTKKDRQRLKELETEIGPLPFGETPTDIEAMDIIRRAAERLKQQNDQTPNDSNK